MGIYACGPGEKQLPAVSPDSLFKGFREERLQLFPLLAASIGDNRYKVLDAGSLPLDLLDVKTTKWIAASK